jgi:putative ABC transport system permease protein
MSLLHRPIHRLRTLFGRERLEREMDDELRAHLEKAIEENRKRGLSPEEARRVALVDFGGLDAVKEDCRESWGIRALETLMQDVRYGVRTLRRNPGYAAAVLVTLALGIGANTAVFSVVSSVLLKPLPYAAGDRLVVLRRAERTSGNEDIGFSVQEILDYRRQARSLDGLAEYHSMNFTLFGGPEPQRVRTGVVSASFFDVLGTHALLGRTFLPGEDAIGAEPVLVLSHEYWRRLGSDPGIVGRKFEMNDRVHTVVGVLPALPQYPDQNDVYMCSSSCPFRSSASTIANRQVRMLNAFARVAPGVRLARAQSDLSTVAERIAAEHPEALPADADARTVLSPLKEDLVRHARPTFLVLLATVALVLLIACANVANLALARLSGRSREVAVRAALGAGRVRLLRQLVTETTILALGGGALGLLFAWGTRGVLTMFAARFTPRAGEIAIDGRVLLFTLGVSLVTGLFAGTLPGLPPRDELSTALVGSGRASSSRRQGRVRASLVAWQLALSFMLLIGAALMLRSLTKLQDLDPGFKTENVLTMSVDLNFSRYSTAERHADYAKINAFYEDVHRKLHSEPGVLSVGEAWTVPLNSEFKNDGTFRIEGRAGGSPPKATFIGVSPEYFDAIGVPLIRGRVFDDHDRGTETQAVLVSRGLARRQWGGVDPVGQRVSIDDGQSWRTIVGVVGDVRQGGLRQEPQDTVYVPTQQFGGYTATLFVRTLGRPAAAQRQVAAAVHSVDPETALSSVHTLTEIRDSALAQPRLTTVLLGLFAVVALVITATGLSGLLAYSVSQRTREIGIRMALGADRRGVLALVLGQGLRSVAVGLGVGVVGALALARLVSGLLFGVEPTDPICFVGSAAVLVTVAAVACLVPAQRATAIEPIRALRTD